MLSRLAAALSADKRRPNLAFKDRSRPSLKIDRELGRKHSSCKIWCAGCIAGGAVRTKKIFFFFVLEDEITSNASKTLGELDS